MTPGLMSEQRPETATQQDGTQQVRDYAQPGEREAQQPGHRQSHALSLEGPEKQESACQARYPAGYHVASEWSRKQA